MEAGDGEAAALPLARRLAARFAALPEVAAVALAGSQTTGLASPDSDLDLYVYADPALPLPARAAIAADGEQAELDLSPWEPGDSWLDPASGRRIDVMYRSPAWIEDQLDRLLDRHQPALGYSTALWHNIRTSLPLFDRDGWFAALQRRAAQPYPEELRRAIVAANLPLLRDRSFSYRHQIEAALARNDAVAVQHRLTAFLASYFDVLFALNRLPHPGEKRQIEHALRSCPLRPPDLAARLDAIFAAAAPPWPDQALVPLLDALVDDLERMGGPTELLA
jgi:predicted nucleotidyltransferase